jgi:hypothetical protein
MEAGALRVSQTNASITVQNDSYVAVIEKETGRLASVTFATGEMALSGDFIALSLTEGHPPLGDKDFLHTDYKFVHVRDYFVTIQTRRFLPGPFGTRYMMRTYCFTRSPFIFEQIEITNHIAVKTSIPRRIRNAVWTLVVHAANIIPLTAADDIWMQRPDSSLGGHNGNLATSWHRAEFSRTGAFPLRWARDLASGRLKPSGEYPVVLAESQSLVGNAIIAIARNAPFEPEVRNVLKKHLFQFYFGYGLRSRGESVADDARYVSPSSSRFVNWHVYVAANHVVPLTRRFSSAPTLTEWLVEDGVLRLVIHLIDRIRLDQGWPSYQAWMSGDIEYKIGDRFTSYSRAFPIIAYMWSYLTIAWTDDGYQHNPQDADEIYDTLQTLRPFYGLELGGSRTFRDFPSNHAFEYIAYATDHKESTTGKPRRVLNSHAHALHFAWFMQSAARMKLDERSRRAWSQIVSRYHPGSQAIYKQLYPARHSKDDSRRYAGMVNYSWNDDSTKRTLTNAAYSDISHEGIAAGYEQIGGYEPEFIVAVERACRFDSDPKVDGFQRNDQALFVRRFARICPLSMAFSGLDAVNSADTLPSNLHHIAIEISSPEEICKYSALKARGFVVDALHTVFSMPIVVGAFDKIVYTNQDSMGSRLLDRIHRRAAASHSQI